MKVKYKKLLTHINKHTLPEEYAYIKYMMDVLIDINCYNDRLINILLGIYLFNDMMCDMDQLRYLISLSNSELDVIKFLYRDREHENYNSYINRIIKSATIDIIFILMLEWYAMSQVLNQNIEYKLNRNYLLTKNKKSKEISTYYTFDKGIKALKLKCFKKYNVLIKEDTKEMLKDILIKIGE